MTSTTNAPCSNFIEKRGSAPVRMTESRIAPVFGKKWTTTDALSPTASNGPQATPSAPFELADEGGTHVLRPKSETPVCSAPSSESLELERGRLREDSELGLELALLLAPHLLPLAALRLVGDGVASDLGDEPSDIRCYLRCHAVRRMWRHLRPRLHCRCPQPAWCHCFGSPRINNDIRIVEDRRLLAERTEVAG